MRASKEIDSWFDQSKTDVVVLDEFAVKCQKVAQRLCQSRILLAEACSDLAKKLTDFGNFETQLVNVGHFAINFEKTAVGMEKHSQSLNRTLIDGLRLISMHCDSAGVSWPVLF